MSNDREDIVLQLDGIRKSFDNNVILDDMNLTFHRGEVCGILGENAAGKSTMMKIISGIYQPDEGRIFLDGEEVTIANPNAAQKKGILFVMQDSHLVPTLSVEKNIFMGREISSRSGLFVDRRQHYRRLENVFAFMEWRIDPATIVSTLSLTQRKMVELARVIAMDNARILLLDEITAPFAGEEARKVLRLIQKLRQRGMCILFVSHRMEEFAAIAKRLVILRDGRIIEDIPNIGATTPGYLLSQMAGIDYRHRYPRTRAPKGRILLQTERLSNQQQTVRKANITIREGEIVGIAGLLGAGKSSLAHLLVGSERPHSGSIYFRNKRVDFRRPYQSTEMGIAFLSSRPEDNLFHSMDSRFNITASNLNRVAQHGFVKPGNVNHAAMDYLRRLKIKRINPQLPVRYLSRGNQQKIAFSRVFFTDRQILVLDDPTMGLDIPSKVELYNMLNLLAHKGKGMLYISSDIQELVGMCDRIYVMFNGEITAELPGDTANSLRVLSYMLGRPLLADKL